MKSTIIYLHGFNSASVDEKGQLLSSKNKLKVLEQFCRSESIKLSAANIDYRDYSAVIKDYIAHYQIMIEEGYKVIFMGTSLGGFSSEYLAMKTGSKAIMINPATQPSAILLKYIGITENFETQQSFDWQQENCDQFKAYEAELAAFTCDKNTRTILLDMADELINSSETYARYQALANVTTYEGGSHSFEHLEEALPIIKEAIEV